MKTTRLTGAEIMGVMRQMEGGVPAAELCREHGWNHKRVYRIYREPELNLRIKPRKRLKREKPDALAVPVAANAVWSMDFMADRPGDGRQFRLLNGWTSTSSKPPSGSGPAKTNAPTWAMAG